MTFGDLFEDSGVDGPVPSSASPGFTNLITLVAGYAVQIRQRQRAWPHQCETEKTEPELRLACIPTPGKPALCTPSSSLLSLQVLEDP